MIRRRRVISYKRIAKNGFSAVRQEKVKGEVQPFSLRGDLVWSTEEFDLSFVGKNGPTGMHLLCNNLKKN